MELGKFTTEQLENVKHVMFGKQKQANVTNEAVVKLIASDLVSCYGSSCIDTEESVKESIRRYIQESVDGTLAYNDTILLIIVGEQSYNCLKGSGPKVVSVDTPNPDSPKVLFRVYALGEVPEAEVPTYGLNLGPTLTPANSGVDSSKSLERYDYKTRVENLVKEILPLVPDGVKSELSDPYQQCLCCAEYYYNM